MRSELTTDGIRLTAESPWDQGTILRWVDQTVSIASVFQDHARYTSLTLRFADKVATIGPTTVFPPREPNPFRPTTADGPVPDGWREDCHGDLVTPAGSHVFYEPNCRHWTAFLKPNGAPFPNYFTLRSEAVARLRELLGAEKPEPWCPEVGQWVRVSPDGEVGRVKHVTIESMYGYSPTRSITVAFPGRGPMSPFPPEHLEPWRPRVGERVVVAPSATDTFGGHEGFIKGPAPLAQGTIFWVLVDHHGCTSDILAGLHDLSPAPPVPSKNEIDEWLRRHASVSAVGAEWRFVYPE